MKTRVLGFRPPFIEFSRLFKKNDTKCCVNMDAKTKFSGAIRTSSCRGGLMLLKSIFYFVEKYTRYIVHVVLVMDEHIFNGKCRYIAW